VAVVHSVIPSTLRTPPYTLLILVSALNRNLEAPVYFLKPKQGCTGRKYTDTVVYIEKCRYYIQKQKEVPVWFFGIYRPISGMGPMTMIVE
jgi:hypothetical protein